MCFWFSSSFFFSLKMTQNFINIAIAILWSMCAKIFALNISGIYWIISRIFEFCLKRNDSRKMKQLKKWMMKKKTRKHIRRALIMCNFADSLRFHFIIRKTFWAFRHHQDILHAFFSTCFQWHLLEMLVLNGANGRWWLRRFSYKFKGNTATPFPVCSVSS